MSSITETQTQQLNDPSQQLAPEDGSGPDFGALKKAFETCVNENQSYTDQCRQNFETRYAMWMGQTPDGKKHARETDGKASPTPWDGASDLRVYLVDEAINSKVALQCMAFRKANLVATPVEGNDLKRAKVVSNFMRWLVQTQIPEIDREVELLSQYLNEKGAAVSGQFWEETQEKTLVTLTVEQFQQRFPNVDVQMLLNEPTMADDFMETFEKAFGCSPKKTRKMLKEMREDGKTTVATLGKKRSRPVIRAFNLDQNLFIPNYSTDIERASAIWRVEYFTPEQLRAFAYCEGWDSEWVEDAIKTCRGKYLTVDPQINSLPQSRSFIYTDTRKIQDLIGCVFGYQRLSDEDGVPGIYLTIFSPFLPPNERHDGYAKSGLLGYAHGEYPFVLHRREYLSRKLHDSRGLPEPGKPLQDQIKAHKDSMIDAASIAVIPPLGHPQGRPPLKWGPGARIPERRQGEYHFMDRPMPDLNTQESITGLQSDFARYCGFVSPETDPTFAALKNQQEVNKFLAGWARAYRQIWKLYQQYGSEEVYFRVVGLKQVDPTLFNKGDPNEEYDVVLNWDVQSMDAQIQGPKLELLGKIVNTYDQNGVVDRAELLQVFMEAVDPNIAERVIQPQAVGAQKAIKDEQDALAKIYSGIAEDIKIGAPPQIGLSVMQQWMQQPDVNQRYRTDEAFKNRVDTRVKQYQFQSQQQENAQIGRMGAVQTPPASMQQQSAA